MAHMAPTHGCQNLAAGFAYTAGDQPGEPSACPRNTAHCVIVSSKPKLKTAERDPEGAVAVLPTHRTDDAELVRELLNRRPAAVAELFERFDGLVRALLMRTLGTSFDVDDLAQDTFLTVVRKLPGLRDPGALRSFVVSVALRVARNELRKRSVRRWVGLHELHEPPVSPPHDASVVQGIRHIYAALDRLEPGARVAFVMRHVEGYDLLETARACGCSLATIKRRLARAERRFEAFAKADPVLESFLRSGEEDEP